MSNLGLGVMIKTLFGGDTNAAGAVKQTLGKTITALELVDNNLVFTFEDNSKLKLWDGGQSCCESRYMRTDDNLSDYVGGQLLDMGLRDAPDQEDEYGEVHEVQFLAVKTNKGEFVMSNHNEHNGYYGGFRIEAEVLSH